MVKVLIVDDSAFMLKMLKNIVQKSSDASVLEAKDGNEALEKYKSEQPDLVLLDIILPVMRGVEVLKEIKKLNSNAKVVMITAVGQEEVKQEATQAGCVGFIVKPFQEDEIIEQVKKALG